MPKVTPEELAAASTTEGALRAELRTTRQELRDTQEKMAKLAKSLDLVQRIEGAEIRPPTWLRRPPKASKSAVACILLTDTHFDGVVNPAEVMSLNAYGRRIGELRLEAAVTNAVRIARDYVAGIDYAGAVLFLGGDMIEGEIHDELRETNEGTVVETLLHWTGPMAAGIDFLTEAFGKLHVAAVVGNHGRRQRKPPAKRRAADNYDWLLYKLLARQFAADERITFQVPEAADALVPVLGTRYLLTHGDQFRGGSGISGSMAPLALGEHRKRKKHGSAEKLTGKREMAYDILVMGHWHQRLRLPGVMVSGSLKGYDEFSFVQNFAWEPPTQSFWITDPEHGPTIEVPIHVMDRKAEKW